MKKTKYATIMVVSDEQRTETFRVNTWLLRHSKQALLTLAAICIGLLVGLVALTTLHLKTASNNQELQGKVKALEDHNSVEAAAKINELKKTEKTILQLQEYLNERGANNPTPKTQENSATDPQPLGGAYHPIAGEIPFTSRYNQNAISLLEKIRNTPIGVPHDGYLTSRFGSRANPFSNQGEEFHPGLDFKAPYGDPIHATADGKVVFAGVMNGYGNVVRIAHSSGYETLFAHMSVIRVTLGQSIKAGDTVGEVGSTGRSTGPHLHYEVRLNNQPLDPEQFLTINTAQNN
ncbi:M23 family metallopeptidase [Hydromonas duriensis]|nr:M23 family metallopeptidase [Hydromonas duriensis]